MKERSLYEVRNPAKALQMRAAYTAKLAANRASGVKQLTEGSWNTFRGWPESWAKDIAVIVAEFDDTSNQELRERVTDPIAEIAEREGIAIAVAGDFDLPPHIMLHVDQFKDMSPEEIATVIRYLQDPASRLPQITATLVGQTFSYDSVVVAANSYICPGEFSPLQGGPYKIRHLADRILQRSLTRAFADHESTGTAGPTYPRYDDIFHTSVARFTQEPSPDTRMNFLRFAREVYTQVGDTLANAPLRLTVNRINTYPDVEYIRERCPHLVV